MAENMFDKEMSNIETPTLTLDADDKKLSDIFTEPAPESISLSTVETSEVSEYSAGAVNEANLTDDEKKQVAEFAKQIDLTDVRQVNTFGASAQKGIASFSSSITSKVKTKEFGEVGESLRELRVAINGTTEPEKKSFLGKLFQSGKQKITYFIANYQTAETNVNRIEKDLKKHQQTLTKDIFVYDQMYDLNLKYYKEITMYIIAGKKALDEARSVKLPEYKAKAEETKDQMDIQAARDFEDTCTRFEKKLFDLETTRMISIQMAPQIRLLQNDDKEMVDKLHSDIINTIPLWRNQMVLALGIEHNRRALEAQSAVTEMTNEMLRRNAETLKTGSIEAAKASERAIVDIETLRQVNSDIITSINEVVKIHEAGSRRRVEAQEELAKLEEELKVALLDAGKK